MSFTKTIRTISVLGIVGCFGLSSVAHSAPQDHVLAAKQAPAVSAKEPEVQKQERPTFNNGVSVVIQGKGDDGKERPFFVIQGGKVREDLKPDYAKVCKMINRVVIEHPEQYPMWDLFRTVVQDHGTKCDFPDKPLPTQEELEELLKKRAEAAKKEKADVPAKQ